MKKKFKALADRFDTPACASAAPIGGPKPARCVNGAPAPIFCASDIAARTSPCQRAGHARRLRQVQFNLRNSDQFALMDVPEIRYWLMWQQRVLIVTAASRLVESKVCSLNAAAKLLGIASSWLSDMLQKFRAGGNAALIPCSKTPLVASGCRLSVFLRL